MKTAVSRELCKRKTSAGGQSRPPFVAPRWWSRPSFSATRRDRLTNSRQANRGYRVITHTSIQDGNRSLEKVSKGAPEPPKKVRLLQTASGQHHRLGALQATTEWRTHWERLVDGPPRRFRRRHRRGGFSDRRTADAPHRKIGWSCRARPAGLVGMRGGRRRGGRRGCRTTWGYGATGWIGAWGLSPRLIRLARWSMVSLFGGGRSVSAWVVALHN